MDKNQGKFLLIMGIVILALSIYLVTIDPLVGIIGLLVGVWNIFNGIRTLRGKMFFKIDEDEE